ncbi:FUSC family protein [Uliginosibacterium sp. H1]|uniref:FUSC family protein n=1 Tax=Uliginosibacterium sp. H1 TaxID=3114757 RepID=UPI002E18826E|nr:FUSC family protein [Uliginosibacterium sp. H1]
MSHRPLLSDLRSTFHRVVHDLKSWPVRGHRLVDELECVLSVLLAVAFAHALDVRHVGWAAFSAYMVMRAHVWNSFKRGALRVIGTAAGAALAWYLSGVLPGTWWASSLALLVVVFVTFYLMMVSPRGYAWLFMGLTFAMVIVDGLQHPAEPIEVFAWTRFVEVAAGTAACVIVSALSTLTVRRHVLGQRGFSMEYEWWAKKLTLWHPVAFMHAVQGAVAMALIPLVWWLFGLQALAQASITIAVVMAIPLHTVGDNRTRVKLVHRFVGCVAGVLFATAALLVAGPSPLALTLFVVVAVMAGRHIENGRHGIDYIGTQFVLAVLVVLVPDSYAGAHMEVGFQRVTGVLLGIALLEPVRLLLRLPAPRAEG